MAISAIYQKEWFKLKGYSLALAAAVLALAGYFWFNLTGQFAAIEPESMMWYRFAHLGDKPYGWLLYCFTLTGAITAVCQFVPEMVGKKVRILTHLPVPLNTVVVKHLLAGSLMILLINGLLGGLVVLAFADFYPADIVQICLKDMLFGQLPALAIYLGLTACIVEANWRRKVLKFVLSALTALVLLKDHYQLYDALWLLLIIWLILPVTDSFLSVKTRRLNHKAYALSIPLVGGLLVVASAVRLYDEFAVSHDRYYVFYSPVLEQYVYQQNGSGHQFVYGTNSTVFDKTRFEEALPFVFWKNLDIQGKLPVSVNGESFSKQQIRSARMSLQYDPSRLVQPEVALYPLFNPISHKGSIPFPEEAFAVKAKQVVVYDAETALPNRVLSDELNRQLAEVGVTFPVRKVWGKTTNMKPFDWGYFIADSHNRIFNLRRADNVVKVEAVPLPDSVGELVYMQVSENRHKKFYGYAVSADSKVYLVSYPDYRFIPLPLSGFNYQNMSLQLLSDPLYYLVRYDDGEHYHAARFDKQYNQLDSVTFR